MSEVRVMLNADVRVMLNAYELAALAGLPSLAVVAYVLAIRPWMDYRTGLCGIARGISWQSIREAVEVEGHQGMPRQTFTEAQCRRAVAHLEKRGLLTRRSTDAALVFRANLATRDNGVEKKAVPMLTPKAAPIAQPAMPATALDSGNGKPKAVPKAVAKAVPPPAEPLTSNQSSSSYLPDVVGDAAQTTTTAIVFHRVIKPEFQAAMLAAVAEFSAEDQQLALDELAGAILSRAGGNNPIRSQLSYLRAIVANVRSGAQVWTNALEVAAARRAEAARIEREASMRQLPTPPAASRFRPGVSLAETLKGMK